MKKWSKEKAWKWYNKLPWIRGFCYYPSCCVNRVEMWQEYNWDYVKSVIDKELALAHEWGFNAVRIIGQLEVYIDQKKSYLEHIEEFLEIAHKYNIYVMFCFGNDCVVQKHNYEWPKYGPQEFDFGYHSGRAKSPHVVMNEPGYNIIDEPEYEQKFYEMVETIISKYKDDERILIWDLYNEPGNSLREMRSFKYIQRIFEIGREINPIQPLAACCWLYDKSDQPFKEIELRSLDLSDVILYHCYLSFDQHDRVVKYLKEKYDRPLFNTEWLHRIWHNNVEDLFPYFRENRIGCFNWGWVTGKSQTREPWEWLFNEYDKGRGRDWDFSKWQHDLVRSNLRPYDYKEYEIIKRENQIADEEYKKRNG